jgi:DNA-binding response OmpR family regulator
MGTKPRPQDSLVRSSTIVVVDDDEMIRDALSSALSEAGFDVALACDGEEGLATIRACVQKPRLVILDLQMPRLDGAGVFGTLQSDARLADVPVVISTAAPWRAPRGARVMPKPIDLDDIVELARAIR